MKRFISILLVLTAILSTLALTSCGQEDVDKMYKETKENVAELLAPFFKQFEGTEESADESTEQSEEIDTEQSTDASDNG